MLFAHDPPVAPPLRRKEPGTSGGRQGCQKDRGAPGKEMVDHVGSSWKKCRTVSKCPVSLAHKSQKYSILLTLARSCASTSLRTCLSLPLALLKPGGGHRVAASVAETPQRPRPLGPQLHRVSTLHLQCYRLLDTKRELFPLLTGVLVQRSRKHLLSKF